MSFLMVGALAVFQMVSALVQGLHPLGDLGKAVDVVGMIVLLALSALLPLACGSWRASYAHPYIHTRESSADDDENAGRPAGASSGRRVRYAQAVPGGGAAEQSRSCMHVLPTAFCVRFQRTRVVLCCRGVVCCAVALGSCLATALCHISAWWWGSCGQSRSLPS